MSIAKFRVKYPRPTKLSDPYYDFTPDLLDKLLATPDDQMGLREYRNLLGPFLPAGTYEESIYFLPNALRYVLKSREFELMTSVIWFASEFIVRLEDDGIADDVRECLREYLRLLTRHFKVEHFDQSACRKMGWKRDYSDFVPNADLLAGATEDLVRFKTFEELATGFVYDLAYPEGNPVKAAWFLAYARSQGDVYQPPDYEPIKTLINDPLLLRLAAELVSKKLVPNEPSPTYWRDTFERLDIDWSLPDTAEKKPPYPGELKSYIDKEGRLTQWPSPTNKKGLQRIALAYLASKFEFERMYTEREVNAILKEWHTFSDHALLRRELYDKGFFDRKADGSQYWRTEPSEG